MLNWWASKIIFTLIKKNKIRDGYIRPIIFRDSKSMSDISRCEVKYSLNWIGNYLKINQNFFNYGKLKNGSKILSIKLKHQVHIGSIIENTMQHLKGLMMHWC